jgi:hypothetical protein
MQPTSPESQHSFRCPWPVKNGGGPGARLAKPGMALLMRTPGGEENRIPFRSLDDLLSAVKPILRAVARSPTRCGSPSTGRLSLVG